MDSVSLLPADHLSRGIRAGLAVALASAPGVAQTGCSPTWLPTFGGTPGTNGTVRTLAVFDDGGGAALYAAGDFTSAGGVSAVRVARWGGAEWGPVGSVAPTGADETVRALTAFDAGGGSVLYAGGSFTSIAGQATSGIAAWDGAAWSPVSGGVGGAVHALAVFDDGTGPALYAAGSFAQAGGATASNVARWDGVSWSALGSGTDGAVHALAVYDDGAGAALFAAGSFTQAGGIAAGRVARWDGSAWSALGAGTDDTVRALAVFDDGNGDVLVAGGDFANAGAVSAVRIASWDGATWSNLGALGIDGAVEALAQYDDGSGNRLYATGGFSSAGGVGARGVARWNGAGWSALASGGVGVDTGFALAVFDEGSGAGPTLFVGGDFQSAGTVAANRVARWDGSGWSPLGTGVADAVLALVPFDDGGGPALFAGGRFDSAGGVPALRIAKWNGATWSSLGPPGSGANNDVRALAVFDEGTGPALFAGGDFTSAGGAPAGHLARWDGAGWSTLGAGLDDSVVALGVFDDGMGSALYAGGDFTAAGGAPASFVARWDGSAWSAVGGGMNGPVRVITVFDDGGGPALFAGGDFTTAGGVPALRIAKWDGVAWAPVGGAGVGADNDVRAFAAFDDGTGGGPELFVGGDFTTAGGLPADRVAKWDGVGWSTLGAGPGLNNSVRALAVFDGAAGPALYVGGRFTAAGGQTANRIARWDGTGWSPVGSGFGTGMNGSCRALRVFDDGLGGGAALFASGRFTISPAADSFLARWRCPAPVTTFCTAKTALVCGPATASASGTPSATASSGFVVAAQPVRGCRSGLLLYSNQPIQAGATFGGPGDGLLCLAGSGLRRAGPIESGGTSPQVCDGAFTIDLNRFRSSTWAASGCNPPAGQTNPSGFLSTPGATVHSQVWGRDSVSTGQVLSGGVSWLVGP